MPLFKRKEITFRNDVQMHNVSEKDQNIKCTLHTHQFCYMVTELRIHIELIKYRRNNCNGNVQKNFHLDQVPALFHQLLQSLCHISIS